MKAAHNADAHGVSVAAVSRYGLEDEHASSMADTSELERRRSDDTLSMCECQCDNEKIHSPRNPHGNRKV